MMHEEKKVAKIVEELTMFFFAMGADDIQSEIEKHDRQVVISFHANYDSAYEDKLAGLKEYLTEEKNEGMEDIYWELAGSGDPGETSQLLLVGMMIDKAEISVKEEVREVELKLYKQLL